jgi:hypothetical protein
LLAFFLTLKNVFSFTAQISTPELTRMEINDLTRMEINVLFGHCSGYELRNDHIFPLKKIRNLWYPNNAPVDGTVLESNTFYTMALSLSFSEVIFQQDGQWELFLSYDPPSHRTGGLLQRHNKPELVLSTTSSFQCARGLGMSLYLDGFHETLQFRIDWGFREDMECRGCEDCERLFLKIRFTHPLLNNIEKEVPIALQTWQ